MSAAPRAIAAVIVAMLLPILALAQPATEPTPIYQPHPADLEPLAAKSLMLDVVNTGKRLIAVGDRGHILASVDGKKWAQVAVPVRSALTAVSFSDADHGWAVGHDAVIVQSSDGGRSWNLQNFQPELEKPLLDVLFTDALHGYAVGGFGLFMSTDDGGGNWTELKVPAVSGDELNLYSITRLANGDLLITGEQGRLVLSSDQGRSWKRLKSPINNTVFGAAPVGAQGALICGLRGNAWVSSDVRNGRWRAIDTGTTAAFYGCSAVDDRSVALVGRNGTILIADTLGLSTRKLVSPVVSSYSAVTPWRSGLVLSGEQGLQRVTAAGPGSR